MSVVTNIIVGATAGQGNAQIATNAIAPYASQLIGDTFEHTDDPNKAAQLLSHAVLGAIIAYMNGGDAVSGAASATASELASMVLAKELYPEAFDEDGNLVRSDLSEEQAESIVAITNAIGALAGGITGGDVTNASIGSFIGENAIKNNFTKIEAEAEQRRLAEYGIPSIALLDPSSPGGYIVVPISETALRAVVTGVENLTEEERAQLAQAQNGLMDISDVVEMGTIAAGIYAGAEIIYVGGKYLIRNGDKLFEITKDQYNKLVRGGGDSESITGKLTNDEARDWYNSKVSQINVDVELTEENARIISSQRAELKYQARELMEDQHLREQLDKEFPIMDFEYYQNKYSSQGYSGTELWEKIIDSSKTTNSEINSMYGSTQR